MIQQEGQVEDARQAGGKKHNKRGRNGQLEVSGWQMMGGDGAVEDTMWGDRVANDTTRRGGRRTWHKAIRWGTTQREEGVDDARQSGWWRTRQKEGGKGPNAVADDDNTSREGDEKMWGA
jgi:hypothetical protein